MGVREASPTSLGAPEDAPIARRRGPRRIDRSAGSCYGKTRGFADLTKLDPSSDRSGVVRYEAADTTLSPRRKSKRRSAEVRNSLRLFGLLAVLGCVNVYVFFFNHGTAPREVLKPSSTVKAAEGKAGILREATPQALSDRDAPIGGSAKSDLGPRAAEKANGAEAAAAAPKARAPQILGPATAKLAPSARVTIDVVIIIPFFIAIPFLCLCSQSDATTIHRIWPIANSAR